MKVMVAMSGGVDSSVAAALLLEQGHDVTGVTLKLWGGESDTGCCSVSDVDDARRVARVLDIDHHVFNFGDRFEADVVAPYVDGHRHGLTPNPCIECNRHVKFDKLLVRAQALGFDAIATGHHARVAEHDGVRRVARGVDRGKDQSYVLYMLGRAQLRATLLPVGDMTKDEVRARAAALGLPTAVKPDSQDVCFITSSVGRAGFLRDRVDFTPGRVIDGASGTEVGRVDAVELVTIGQRRGVGLPGGDGTPRYVTNVDVRTATVTVGHEHELLDDELTLRDVVWANEPAMHRVWAQCSAHGAVHEATFDAAANVLRWVEPHRRVAPGQAVVLYDGDEVVGGGIAS